jgi:predicted nucleic acid-binding Zn ribbon protein
MLWRLIFVILFQYLVFLVKDILSRIVPDIPSALQAKLARKMHVARMCFRKSAVEAMRESTQQKRVSRNSGAAAHFDGKGFYVERSRRASPRTGKQNGREDVFPKVVFHHQSYV